MRRSLQTVIDKPPCIPCLALGERGSIKFICILVSPPPLLPYFQSIGVIVMLGHDVQDRVTSLGVAVHFSGIWAVFLKKNI